MVPYLRAANVKDGALDLADVKTMDFTPTEQQLFALRSGDVLVTEGSGSLAAVGATAVYGGEVDSVVCFQNTLLRLRPKTSELDPAFLAWWARSAFESGAFAAMATGANIHHLGADGVKSLAIPLPPLREQARVVKHLDRETRRLDTLIAKNQAVAELLSEREIACVGAALGTDLALRGDGVPVAIRGQRMAPLRAVAAVQSGIALNTQQQHSDPVTVPYVRVANVQDGELQLHDIKQVSVPRSAASRWLLQRGDVLMTEGGDPDKLGRGAVWEGQIEPCLHQNHVFAVRPNAAVLLPEFLSLVTRHPYARLYFETTASKTTGIASTSSSKIGAFRVPLPDLKEQRRLVDSLREQVAAIRGLRSAVLDQNDLLRERRQALITATVTGQLDLSEVA